MTLCACRRSIVTDSTVCDAPGNSTRRPATTTVQRQHHGGEGQQRHRIGVVTVRRQFGRVQTRYRVQEQPDRIESPFGSEARRAGRAAAPGPRRSASRAGQAPRPDADRTFMRAASARRGWARSRGSTRRTVSKATEPPDARQGARRPRSPCWPDRPRSPPAGQAHDLPIRRGDRQRSAAVVLPANGAATITGLRRGPAPNRARPGLENAHVAVTAAVIAVPFCIVWPVVAITANTASPVLS